jgi:hypothetical protein
MRAHPPEAGRPDGGRIEDARDERFRRMEGSFRGGQQFN